LSRNPYKTRALGAGTNDGKMRGLVSLPTSDSTRAWPSAGEMDCWSHREARQIRVAPFELGLGQEFRSDDQSHSKQRTQTKTRLWSVVSLGMRYKSLKGNGKL
jgi:hypothetical protein